MNDKTRLGAAVLGGYVLGRTKKGGTALRFAMWLNGTSSGSLARVGVQRLRESPQVTRIVTEMGQPLLSAARQAAVAAVEARLTGVADNLNQRTARLLPAAPGNGSGESDQDTTDQADERRPKETAGPSGPDHDDRAARQEDEGEPFDEDADESNEPRRANDARREEPQRTEGNADDSSSRGARQSSAPSRPETVRRTARRPQPASTTERART